MQKGLFHPPCSRRWCKCKEKVPLSLTWIFSFLESNILIVIIRWKKRCFLSNCWDANSVSWLKLAFRKTFRFYFPMLEIKSSKFRNFFDHLYKIRTSKSNRSQQMFGFAVSTRILLIFCLFERNMTNIFKNAFWIFQIISCKRFAF